MTEDLEIMVKENQEMSNELMLKRTKNEEDQKKTKEFKKDIYELEQIIKIKETEKEDLGMAYEVIFLNCVK